MVRLTLSCSSSPAIIFVSPQLPCLPHHSCPSRPPQTSSSVDCYVYPSSFFIVHCCCPLLSSVVSCCVAPPLCLCHCALAPFDNACAQRWRCCLHPPLGHCRLPSSPPQHCYCWFGCCLYVLGYRGKRRPLLRFLPLPWPLL
jgi:hypothetical protein